MKTSNPFQSYIVNIFSAILVSGPVAWILFMLIELIFIRTSNFEDGSPIFIFIFYIIYVIVGMPVTFIIDLLTRILKIKKTKQIYFVQLILYTLLLLVLIQVDPNLFNTILIVPVYTYFHILFYFRVTMVVEKKLDTVLKR